MPTVTYGFLLAVEVDSESNPPSPSKIQHLISDALSIDAVESIDIDFMGNVNIGDDEIKH